MKSTVVLAGLTALAFPFLAACANPSHDSEAGELRDKIAEMPGVVSADLDYTKPITLDSGKLQLSVEMESAASADEVREVVAVTYAAFEDVHHDEEGDLDITIGDDNLHLRSFEPDADTADVADAAERAVTVFASGQVGVDVNTQDVDAAPHVHTQYFVTVTEPGVESLLSTLTDLEAEHSDIPDAGWTVQAGNDEGWSLSAQNGFPDQGQRRRLEQFRVGLPEDATIWLGDDDNIIVRLPTTTPPAEVSAVVGRHLDLVGGPGKAFYDLQQGGDFLALITLGDCYFDTGATGALLEKDHAEGCTNVTHPESP
ncbi:MAG: hypothetical protein NTX33_00260 [Propionibacteriales bacterium]|nr:hypothetical protein [Propionibacteriales bacterium]